MDANKKISIIAGNGASETNKKPGRRQTRKNTEHLKQMKIKKAYPKMFLAIAATLLFFFLPVCEAQAIAPVEETVALADYTMDTTAVLEITDTEQEPAGSKTALIPGKDKILDYASKNPDAKKGQHSKKDAIAGMSFAEPILDPLTREYAGKLPPIPAPAEIVPYNSQGLFGGNSSSRPAFTPACGPGKNS